MEGTVVERAPEAHCYRCESAEIAGVCVQCRQLMCLTHLPPSPARWVRWLGRLLYRLRVIDQPYDGSAVLCHDCQVRPLLPFLGLMLLLALAYLGFGGWTLAHGAVWGAAVVLIGLMWLGVLWLAPRQLVGKGAWSRRKTVQIMLRMDRCQIEEEVKGSVVLQTTGNYEVHVDEPSPRGTATLVLGFSKNDQEKVARFLRKQRKTARAKLSYRAGYILFKGRIHKRFSTTFGPSVKPLPGPVVALEDKLTNASILTGTAGLGTRSWEAQYGYVLNEKLAPVAFPVQVLPAIRPDSAQQVLDLTIQWRNPFPNTAPIAAQLIDSLEVLFPTRLAGIQYASPGYKSDSDPVKLPDGSEMIRLTWRRVPLSTRDQERQKRIFTIKFEKRILQIDSIQGAVTVIFRNSLAGLTGVEFFGSTGKLSPLDESVDITTKVETWYQLSMATLRHQETLVFPDSQLALPRKNNNEEEGDPLSNVPQPIDPSLAAKIVTPKTYVGVAPNAETVVHLTNALSEAGFHIQWVLENQPQTGSAADITHCSWDIGGRYYQGINPVAFHLMVSGEMKGYQNAGGSCHARVSLAVNGVHATDEMRAEIIETCHRLYREVDTTLNGLQMRSAGAADFWTFDTEFTAAPADADSQGAGF